MGGLHRGAASLPLLGAEVEGVVWWVFAACGWEFEGSVRGFGNESVVLNEGTVNYGFRPVDSELDECKRDPLVALLFRVPNYYRVIEEAVEFGPKSLLKCNWTFPITRHSFGPSTGCLGSQGVGLLVDTV